VRLGSAWRKNSGNRSEDRSSDLNGLACLDVDECVRYQYLRPRDSMRESCIHMRFSAVPLNWIKARALGLTAKDNRHRKRYM
jgi:hypothetical protein